SAPTRRPRPRSSSAMRAISPNTSAMGCWSILAIPPPMKTMPLFIEELTKMLLESTLLREDAEHYALTGPLAAVTIPTTLYDSLMARLDRLPTVREVAQLGAVLGREFAYELLQALTTMEEPTLQHGLRQLVDAELLYQRGRPPRARYLFKHALIQD